MLDVNLLGTGGMVPLPGRYLTALMVRYRGTAVLIDCGEGTQTAIRAAGLGFKQIGVLCLTHFHADHTAGIPGLLLSIGNSGRTEPLTVIGPKCVEQVVQCLCVIASQLPFDVNFIELGDGGGERVLTIGSLTISAHPVEHRIPTYAYRLELARQGRFDTDKALALGVPVTCWKRLQEGEAVESGGRTIHPADVLGAPRRAVKLCYATDLRPAASLAAFAAGADLFICEGIYGDPELLDKAALHRHCHFAEAARMAKEAGAAELWLTHFSPSMLDPMEYLRTAADIFPNVRIGQNAATLRFTD